MILHKSKSGDQYDLWFRLDGGEKDLLSWVSVEETVNPPSLPCLIDGDFYGVIHISDEVKNTTEKTDTKGCIDLL